MDSGWKWAIGTAIAVATMFAAFLAVPQFNALVFETLAASEGEPPIDESMQVPPSEDPNVQPQIPAGFVVVGLPDLERYCQSLRTGYHVVMRFPNTWGYRCAKGHQKLSGNRIGDLYISLKDACAQKFGKGSAEHYYDYHDPRSWVCFAPSR
jgi:hypothetical protein